QAGWQLVLLRIGFLSCFALYGISRRGILVRFHGGNRVRYLRCTRLLFTGTFARERAAGVLILISGIFQALRRLLVVKVLQLFFDRSQDEIALFVRGLWLFQRSGVIDGQGVGRDAQELFLFLRRQFRGRAFAAGKAISGSAHGAADFVKRMVIGAQVQSGESALSQDRFGVMEGIAYGQVADDSASCQ